jgi:hypothetical protein
MWKSSYISVGKICVKPSFWKRKRGFPQAYSVKANGCAELGIADIHFYAVF